MGSSVITEPAHPAVGCGTGLRPGASGTRGRHRPPSACRGGSQAERLLPAKREGELVYVPDISYEQFEQMLKVQRNLANPQRPAFIMTDMAMDASVVGNRLELDVEFTLQGEVLEGGGGRDMVSRAVALRQCRACVRSRCLRGRADIF